MSTVPPPFDAQVHREAWNLLPWIVNGTAADADRRRVEAHLAACPDCREELEFQRLVQEGIALDAGPAHDPVPALQALRARIADADADELAEAPRSGTGLRRTGWVPALVAAVVVQAVGLGALGGLLWSERTGAPAAAYRTLTDASLHGAAAWRLVPSPTLRLAELQALLQQHRLAIVESSGDGAILGVAPPPGTSPDAATLRALRADPRVLLAEPVAGEPAR